MREFLSGGYHSNQCCMEAWHLIHVDPVKTMLLQVKPAMTKIQPGTFSACYTEKYFDHITDTILGSRSGFASSLWAKESKIWLMMLLLYFARSGQLGKFIFWWLGRGQTATCLVSLASSLKMLENGVYFKLISWQLLGLTKFQIWKFIYFCQIWGIFSHFRNDFY